MGKQANQSRINRLREAIHDGNPLSIDVRALGHLESAFESGDIDAVKNAMSFGSEIESEMRIRDGVAIIPVRGVLRDEVDIFVRVFGSSSYQLIERDLNSALANQAVKSIVFFHDSPGGSAVGVKRAADAIYEARGTKPIVSYVQGVCGSASYYLAAACDEIKATADSVVGSIGTILPHAEGSKMFEEVGIKYTVITNKDSPKKGHGNIYEPLSDDSRATLQSFVESYGRSFVEDVARYRGITPDQVASSYGQGDAMRADVAIHSGLIDAVVANFSEAMEPLSSGQTSPPVEETDDGDDVVTESFFGRQIDMKVSKKIRAQLFALDLIESPDASDETCNVALKAWFRGNAPEDEASVLGGLRESPQSKTADKDSGADDEDDDDDPDGEEDGDNPPAGKKKSKAKSQAGGIPDNVQQAHASEQAEARLADLKASADLVNEAAGYAAVSSDMVLSAFSEKLDASAAMKSWNKTLSEKEPPVPGSRIKVTGEGRDRFGVDAVEALVAKATGNSSEISEGASNLLNRPLWAIAAESMQHAGHQVDMYGDPELLAEQAMSMGTPGQRHTFYSANEGRQYIQNAGTPFARPGDFPNILSSLANKFLDTIQLDDDYSYTQVSALLPGGLRDFKPALMMNKGIVEELDELQDAEQFNDLGLEEEVLSYIFLRRFGNKWGWTPVMIANDDLGAFVEGMLGLQEAWQVTQNRLVVDLFTSNPTLLDGNSLFGDRADTGTGTNPATNNNDRSSGNAPSDTEWEAMEVLYSDIGGIGTGRRVRGTLNTCFTPTGANLHEARRTFAPFGQLPESKVANTTANIGMFRGSVDIIPESELRVASKQVWYGLRNPTRLNTATMVRGYFNGFGTAGRRERWYDPTNKTTYVSLEGRIATAVKNWRYAIRNAGTGA